MIVASVVVPTYNRLPRLKKVLGALESQTYPLDCFEVVVVSDGSTDGTSEYLQTLDTPLNVKFVLQANQGVAAARNHGLEGSVGDLIIFVDDDVVPTPALVAEHVRIHEESGDNLVVIGPMLTPDLSDFDMLPWVQWEQSKLMEQYDDFVNGRVQPSPKHFYTGNSSLARKHLLSVGGFDKQFRRAEDVELAYRLQAIGLTFAFHKDAIGYHYAERSYASWLAIPYTYGRNDMLFARLKGHTWLIVSNLQEYRRRHLLVRVLVRICLDRPLLSKVATWSLKIAADIGYRLNLSQMFLFAYSGIFNLRHFQGFCKELGGRDIFFAGVKQVASGQPFKK